jgi:hypothetical protein
MYYTILLKIEQRKKLIQNKVQMRFWNNDINCFGDFADDVYLNSLYEKLENMIKKDNLVKKRKERMGYTIKELSFRYNIPLDTLENRIYNLRWSIERSIMTPIDYKKGVIHK